MLTFHWHPFRTLSTYLKRLLRWVFTLMAEMLGVHADILKLGLVSLLTDVSSEMIFSVFAVILRMGSCGPRNAAIAATWAMEFALLVI